MTPRQATLLRFVEQHIADTGCAPTLDKMREELGLASKGTVHRMLDHLIAEGRLVRRPRVPHGIDLAPRVDQATAGIRLFTTDALRAELARRGEPA